MFSSDSNVNNDPISNNQSIFQRPFINDINPNSKQEDLPLSFFHFPSPFIPYDLEVEDHHIYLPQQQHDLFLQQQPLRADNMTVINMADSIKNDFSVLTKDCNKKNHNTAEQIPRKRSSKRDRHSKIKTAQGLRDRRMRLSLDVAREFFQLQDMLSYDKASKTVEWLLIQAKSEIKKLARGLPQMNYSSSVGAKSASSTSECEVLSGVDEASIKGSISKGKLSIKEKKTRQSRKSAFHPLTKDKRKEARARARERTSKKMWGQKFDESKIYIDARNHDLSQLGSCSPFETGEESGTQSHSMNPSMEVAVAEVEEPSSHRREYLEIQQDMVEESLVTMGNWSPALLNYLHNAGIPQEHQFADFQIFGKPSEVYYNQNLC